MIDFPNIDPVAFAVGPLEVRWYGLMYLIGFVSAYWLCSRRAKMPNSGWTQEQVSDLIFYGALGVILGGRMGYMIFYNFPVLLENPLSMFKVWEGGMSFHGGLLGVSAAVFIFALRYNKRFFDVLDFGSPMVPIGLGTGRLGNFIGGELWGRPTDAPWGMIFPRADDQPRHPSQLYEFFLEGVVLFIILYWFSRKPRPRMAVAGSFLIGYGVFRFAVEFTRQPDAHLGHLIGWMTMGQILSAPMIIGGIGLVAWAYKFNPTFQEEYLAQKAEEEEAAKAKAANSTSGKKKKKGKKR